jgi:class 3 adenylate cyclase
MEPLSRDADVNVEGPLNTAVLFVDLVSSSEFASVLDLRDYAEYVQSFRELCREQCKYYFSTFLGDRYEEGLDYEIQGVGDELAVFLHTGRLHNDVYQLVCLAIALKCGWLAAPLNVQRIRSGINSAELAVGIHCGTVWARRDERGFAKCGFAINIAKRCEAASRDGQHFRILLSDPAFKQVNRRMRNLLFGPRQVVQMKGIVVPVGVHELYESFVNPMPRLLPRCQTEFPEVARAALASNTFDLWTHSCLQVWEEATTGCISESCLRLCEQTLNIDPRNAAALYYSAQGIRERGDMESARLYLEDLVRYWPNFGDGWLELGRVLKTLGMLSEARRALLQSRRCGIDPAEEELPQLDNTN